MAKKLSKKEEADKKIDAEVAKKVKESIYAKACPSGHFKGVGIEVQQEIATEAARHLLVKDVWDVEALKNSKGEITLVVIAK